MSLVAYIVAIVCLVLAALDATLGGVNGLDWIACGLVAFALGHTLPGGYLDGRLRRD